MGMSIRFVGERTADVLAQEFRVDIDSIMNASAANELERVEEVGPRISQRQLWISSRARHQIANSSST